MVRIALLLFVVSSCSSSDREDKSDASRPTVPGSSVGPLIGTLPIGQRAMLPSGGSVQVFSYEANIKPTNEFSQAPSGMEFAVVDAEGCAPPTSTGSSVLNPLFFELVLPDRSAVQSGIPVKEPAMTAIVAPGTCSRGYATFELPRGTRPLFVTYGTPEVSIQWTIP